MNKIEIEQLIKRDIDGQGTAIDLGGALPKILRALNGKEIATPVTHAELLALRAQKELVPGHCYRITDYVATTSQEDTRSANHPFDLVVMALSDDTLSEDAGAIQHEGDTYFANSKLAGWKVKYCIDNDATRFGWAFESGKGVIYRLVDEFGNSAPFDFKGIQLRRYAKVAANIVYDVDNANMDKVAYFQTLFGDNAPLAVRYGYNYDAYKGEDFSFDNPSAEIDAEAFYIPLDDPEWNNDPYIIVKLDAEEIGWLYMFDADDSTRTDLSLSGLENSVYGNKFGVYVNTDGDSPVYAIANNVFFGTNNHSNTFGNYCYNNTFGNSCHSNTFGNGCYYNTFGNYFQDNTFGNDCSDNTFGDYCYNNTFGNYFQDNTFGNNCSSNTFGDNCSSNTFGISVSYNTFGNGCSDNTFGNNCSSNTFGDNCSSNTFGISVSYNTFGNFCSYNTFGNDCYYNTFGNSVRYCTINQDVQYISIVPSTNKTVKYCEVLSGTHGESGNLLEISFVEDAVYAQCAGLDNVGSLAVWLPSSIA